MNKTERRGGDKFRSIIDIVFMNNFYISLKIGYEFRKLIDGNVEYGDILDEAVFFIGEFLTCQHHEVQCDSKLSSNSVRSFFHLPVCR